MITKSKAEVKNNRESTPALARVLEQSEHAMNLIEESAEKLNSVNSGIKKKLKSNANLPVFENILDQNEAVEAKVLEASEKLAVVNVALEGEIQDRTQVDLQLAAAVEQSEASRQAALHDVLTNLPNRALFDDRLKHGLAQAARHDWMLAVMFVDLNDFKEVNDTYGHDAGDRVLQTIAQRLKKNTRGDDTISRYGGDEFLYLVMEAGDEGHIVSIAKKIIENIQKPCNVTARGLPICPQVKASVGIAIFPKNGTTADMLITSADKAMYRAKQAKSGYEFAD